jgi:heme exporter protein D
LEYYKYPINNKLFWFVFLNPQGGPTFHLWFIYALFLISIFILFVKPINQKILKVLLLGISFFAVLIPIPKIFCLNLALNFFFFFLAGFYLSNLDIENLNFNSKLVSLFLISFLVTVQTPHLSSRTK